MAFKSLDHALFQAGMWREYANTFNGSLTRTGVDSKWVEVHLRMNKQDCINRALEALAAAYNFTRTKAMTEEESFMAAIRKNSRYALVFSDWLSDHGRDQESKYWRMIGNAVHDISLPEMLVDYDWKEALGIGHHIEPSFDPCPPDKGVAMGFNVGMIDYIVAAANGENDAESWLSVMKLKDGRFIFADAGCDYTGWDCRGGSSIEIADDLNSILLIGLEDNQRARLNLPERI